MVVQAHITKMKQLRAEEALHAIDIAQFGYAAENDAQLQHRIDLIARWEHEANGEADTPVHELPDGYRIGGTVYVKTAAALNKALGEKFTHKQDRKVLRLTDERDGRR